MFQTVYTPERDVAIDESLLLWKGRLIFRQYIPLKRARFGIKIFALCDKSGYTYRFRVYTGREDNAQDVTTLLPSNTTNFNKPEKMVVYLLLPLLGKGYSAYMDNWYTTTRLFCYLHQQATMACGTIRLNHIPSLIRTAHVQQDATLSFHAGPLLCLKFRDKKDVHVLTTTHDDGTRVYNARGRRREQRRQLQKPVAVIDYNRNMGGVDIADQMIQPYSAARKTLKWYKKLAIHLIQIALLNALILYKKTGGQYNFLKFQHEVIASLLFNIDAPDQTNKTEDIIRLTERHFPSKVEASATWTRRQKRCRVCSKRGVRRDVIIYCEQCPSKPGLCSAPCFGIWHTLLQF
ncbi:piggyBac transposable element-derived protein 4-like [Ptychodera flava]|uniref:piggyBac transposable element-derived protein 4-like n=1 Tax=Ptychodera flava TaxID=63121 RepID=UPI00396A4534